MSFLSSDTGQRWLDSKAGFLPELLTEIEKHEKKNRAHLGKWIFILTVREWRT